MKLFALYLTFLISFFGCSVNKHVKVDDLLVPEEGLKLVQHTKVKELRYKNSLYLPSRKINNHEFSSNKLNNLIKAMRLTMHNNRGVGIAANQVDKNLQLFLIEANKSSLWHEKLDVVPYQIFINPRITKVSNNKKNFWHGCLSGRGEKMGNVATYEWIEYETYDFEGNLHKGKLDGFAAVIFQHEMRHLLGGTYLDKSKEYVDVRDFHEKVYTNEIPFFEIADKRLPVLLDDYLIGESLDDYYSRNQVIN